MRYYAVCAVCFGKKLSTFDTSCQRVYTNFTMPTIQIIQQFKKPLGSAIDGSQPVAPYLWSRQLLVPTVFLIAKICP
jgi:hypothetical protein